MVRWTCSRHGEKVQMYTGEVGSRGDSAPEGGLRTRCFRANHGAGRSRKTALALGEEEEEEEPVWGSWGRRNPSS